MLATFGSVDPHLGQRFISGFLISGTRDFFLLGTGAIDLIAGNTRARRRVDQRLGLHSVVLEFGARGIFAPDRIRIAALVVAVQHLHRLPVRGEDRVVQQGVFTAAAAIGAAHAQDADVPHRTASTGVDQLKRSDRVENLRHERMVSFRSDVGGSPRTAVGCQAWPRPPRSSTPRSLRRWAAPAGITPRRAPDRSRSTREPRTGTSRWTPCSVPAGTMLPHAPDRSRSTREPRTGTSRWTPCSLPACTMLPHAPDRSRSTPE